jgi:hypothetical protein
MAIEARENAAPKTTADLSRCTVVNEITPDMIILDLAYGLTRAMIASKYAYVDHSGVTQPFELWMVDEMFKDPILKNRKPSKVKRLPFRFKASDPSVVIMDVDFDPLAPVAATTVTVDITNTVDTTTTEVATADVFALMEDRIEAENDAIMAAQYAEEEAAARAQYEAESQIGDQL